ncbi:MAG: hypothetical protein JSV85_03330 [Candidatus Bathyarchaeota archaeon]|nr:MAG: hypothetical protein JSV85_03330 [Candidatus Bathyarchaeota archaeon]
MSGKPKTEKLQILAVLEDGYWKKPYRIRWRLEKGFDLRPRLNTLRKNLQRCYKQGLVERRKIASSYFYRIKNRGRERLRIIRAKREKMYGWF